MEQKQEENIVRTLHTELPNEVFTNLRAYAMSLSTARGYWDFGVAIRSLLEKVALYEKVFELEARLNMLELQLSEKNFDEQEQKTEREEEKKPEELELLGGHTVRKNG